MKKAKIVLTAVAVLAVVGGALAFKANRFVHTFYQSTVAGGPCAVTYTTLWSATTLQTNGVDIISTRLSTTRDLVNPCPVITIKKDL